MGSHGDSTAPDQEILQELSRNFWTVQKGNMAVCLGAPFLWGPEIDILRGISRGRHADLMDFGVLDRVFAGTTW